MLSCCTEATYNGILITNVLTESVDQQTVYDDTGVDPIGIHTVVTFTGVLHTAGSGPDTDIGRRVNYTLPSGEGLAPGIDSTVEQLLMPRKRFTYTVGGETWWDILPGAVEPCSSSQRTLPTVSYLRMDIAHGPRTRCQIKSIRGTRSALARISVEFTRPIRCGDIDATGVLNLRWWIHDDIDCKSWLTTRTYTGSFRVAHKDINPHAIARLFTLPPLQNGFRRDRIAWHENPNGLGMSFSIVDVEQWAQAPKPASHWEGTYTVSFPQMGITTEAELTFRLIGPKNGDTADTDKGDKQQLLALAERIIQAKLHWSRLSLTTQRKDGRFFLLSSTWQEQLERNEINVSVRVKYTGDGKKDLINLDPEWVAAGGAHIFELGRPLDRDQNGVAIYEHGKEVSWVPPTIPTATTAGLFITSLQTHCCPLSLSNGGAYPTVTGRQTELYQSPQQLDTLSTYDGRYSLEHHKAMYAYYWCSSRFVGDTGWRAFPKGKQCNAPGTGTDRYDTVSFAQIHCPVQIREVRIHAARINAWPELPKPVHWVSTSSGKSSIKHVLKDWVIEPSEPQLSADGQDCLYEVTATYWYYLSRWHEPNEDLPVGIVPYADRSAIAKIMIQGGMDSSRVAPQFLIDPATLLDKVTP